MKAIATLLALLLLTGGFGLAEAEGQVVVSFEDDVLAFWVAYELRVSPPITVEDMARLTSLNAPLQEGRQAIGDLSGLEHAENLAQLVLWGHEITDLTPLADLTNLERLDLSSNSITDLSPLAGLTQLSSLVLHSNNIADLSPLANLTQLTRLDLRSNNIADLSPLANLTQLTRLDLSFNNITDLSPLAGLTQLTSLVLHSNNISDLSPLASLPQLENLDLSSNNIADLSPLAGLTQLRSTINLRDNVIRDISPMVENNTARGPQPPFSYTIDLRENYIDFSLGTPGERDVAILTFRRSVRVIVDPQKEENQEE